MMQRQWDCERVNQYQQQLPECHSHAIARNIKDNLSYYVFGGEGQHQLYNTLYKITMEGGQIVQINEEANDEGNEGEEYPIERRNHAIGMMEARGPQEHLDIIIVYGGFNLTKGALRDMWIYNIYTRKWKEIKPLNGNEKGPGPMYKHTICIYQNEMIVYGGLGSDRSLQAIHHYNIQTNTWKRFRTETSTSTRENKERYPIHRYDHTAVMKGMQMILFGGLSLPGMALNDTWMYNVEKKEFIELKATGSVPAPRYGHTACISQNSMYVFGGYNIPTDQALFQLDILSGYWRNIQLGYFPNLLTFRTASTIVNNNMVIYGGMGLTDRTTTTKDTITNEMHVIHLQKKMAEKPQDFKKNDQPYQQPYQQQQQQQEIIREQPSYFPKKKEGYPSYKSENYPTTQTSFTDHLATIAAARRSSNDFYRRSPPAYPPRGGNKSPPYSPSQRNQQPNYSSPQKEYYSPPQQQKEYSYSPPQQQKEYYSPKHRKGSYRHYSGRDSQEKRYKHPNNDRHGSPHHNYSPSRSPSRYRSPQRTSPPPRRRTSPPPRQRRSPSRRRRSPRSPSRRYSPTRESYSPQRKRERSPSPPKDDFKKRSSSSPSKNKSSPTLNDQKGLENLQSKIDMIMSKLDNVQAAEEKPKKKETSPKAITPVIHRKTSLIEEQKNIQDANAFDEIISFYTTYLKKPNLSASRREKYSQILSLLKSDKHNDTSPQQLPSSPPNSTPQSPANQSAANPPVLFSPQSNPSSMTTSPQRYQQQQQQQQQQNQPTYAAPTFVNSPPSTTQPYYVPSQQSTSQQPTPQQPSTTQRYPTNQQSFNPTSQQAFQPTSQQSMNPTPQPYMNTSPVYSPPKNQPQTAEREDNDASPIRDTTNRGTNRKKKMDEDQFSRLDKMEKLELQSQIVDLKSKNELLEFDLSQLRHRILQLQEEQLHSVKHPNAYPDDTMSFQTTDDESIMVYHTSVDEMLSEKPKHLDTKTIQNLVDASLEQSRKEMARELEVVKLEHQEEKRALVDEIKTLRSMIENPPSSPTQEIEETLERSRQELVNQLLQMKEEQSNDKQQSKQELDNTLLALKEEHGKEKESLLSEIQNLRNMIENPSMKTLEATLAQSRHEMGEEIRQLKQDHLLEKQELLSQIQNLRTMFENAPASPGALDQTIDKLKLEVSIDALRDETASLRKSLMMEQQQMKQKMLQMTSDSTDSPWFKSSQAVQEKMNTLQELHDKEKDLLHQEIEHLKQKQLEVHVEKSMQNKSIDDISHRIKLLESDYNDLKTKKSPTSSPPAQPVNEQNNEDDVENETKVRFTAPPVPKKTRRHSVAISKSKKHAPVSRQRAMTVLTPNAVGESEPLYCIALFDAKVECDEDLMFQQGDMLQLLRVLDDYWFECRHTETNEIGTVPRNFVDEPEQLGDD